MYSFYIIIVNFKKRLSILHSQLSCHRCCSKNIAMIFDIMAVYLHQDTPVFQQHVDCLVSCRHSPNPTLVCLQGCAIWALYKLRHLPNISFVHHHALVGIQKNSNSSGRLLHLGISQLRTGLLSKSNCLAKYPARAHTSMPICPHIYERQIYCLSPSLPSGGCGSRCR